MFYRCRNQNGTIPVLTAEPKVGNVSLSFASLFFSVLNILSSAIAFLNYSVQLFKLAFIFALQNNLLSSASFTVIFQMIHDQVKTHNFFLKLYHWIPCNVTIIFLSCFLNIFSQCKYVLLYLILSLLFCNLAYCHLNLRQMPVSVKEAVKKQNKTNHLITSLVLSTLHTALTPT